MRVHVVSLPHTQTTRAYDWCAYTAKVRRLGGMLHAKGHQMFLYAGTENEAVCEEFISVVSREEQEAWWPDWDWREEPWPNGWDASSPWWKVMNARAIAEIWKRWEPGDAVGIIGGNCQADLQVAFAPNLVIEWGIGYSGILADTHHAFESSAWMHHVYGQNRWERGRFFDTVIPNAFDTADLTMRQDNDGYLLYLGRMVESKGLVVVEELAQRHPVVTAGQGTDRVFSARDHVGVVLGQEKADLLAGAKAVLVPSLYLEPFGGVAVEAMLSGTPVITTNFGAFRETVKQGVSGFRCSTLQDFVAAADSVDRINPLEVRAWAQQFTVTAVAGQYDKWLRQLDTLHHDGWYELDVAC